MSENPIITELTPEQEALIPVYRDKWLKIALSTESIDEKKAAEAIKEFYKLIGKNEPEIVFCDNPYKLFLELDIRDDYLTEFCYFYNLRHPLLNNSYEVTTSKEAIEISNKLGTENFTISLSIESLIYNELHEKELFVYPDFIHNYSHPVAWSHQCKFYDFCISVLNLPCYQDKWNALQKIVNECWWLFAYKEICFICNRPTSLSFDEQNNLHADGKPAIEYADGFKVYSHHGVWLPEKYGKIPSSEWKSHWLLSEENAELRRVLIQSIGYDKICQELGAIELDSWNEYTLLKIEDYTEINPEHPQNYSESMHLLKMTCPSTGFIHFLRVPPDINSARTAITWINWGIDPEDFDIQS